MLHGFLCKGLAVFPFSHEMRKWGLYQFQGCYPSRAKGATVPSLQLQKVKEIVLGSGFRDQSDNTLWEALVGTWVGYHPIAKNIPPILQLREIERRTMKV